MGFWIASKVRDSFCSSHWGIFLLLISLKERHTAILLEDKTFNISRLPGGASMTQKWLLGLSLLAVLLAACGRPPTTRTPTSVGGIEITPTDDVTVSLSARPIEVVRGSNTVLAVRVEEGSVSTVDVAIKGSTPFVTNIALSETGSYTFTSPVLTQDTIFEVTAKDASGSIIATAETTVLVNPSTASTTPTPETSLPEAPTPAPEPVVEEPLLPEGTVQVTSLEQLQAATAEDSTATTIIVSGTITCDADPCVRLKAGQTLMGDTTNGPDVLVGDRAGADLLTTVIELAPDTSVVGLGINGPDIYTAINGIDGQLSGVILIKDVTITGSTANAPLAVRDTATNGTYSMILENVTINEATRPIGIANFAELEVTDSTFNLNITDNSRGLLFQTGTVGSVVLENVTVNSAVASETFAPVTFTNVGAEGTLGVTISNSTINFPGATPEALATARSIVLESTMTGKIAVQTPTSTGNTTQATSPLTVVYDVAEGADPALVILGYIQGTLGDGTAFVER